MEVVISHFERLHQPPKEGELVATDDGRWLLSIRVRTLKSCDSAVLAMCLSDKSAVYSLPGLRMGFSAGVWIFTPFRVKEM